MQIIIFDQITRMLVHSVKPEALPCLYLGVWARVKRRLCRLMLRFISSLLKSRGEFRGDPRGESLGELLGVPPGEPALDLGLSWMMGSLVTFCSCGLLSTSDRQSSSELSEHWSLMAHRVWSKGRAEYLGSVCFSPTTLCFLLQMLQWHFCDVTNANDP